MESHSLNLPRQSIPLTPCRDGMSRLSHREGCPLCSIGRGGNLFSSAIVNIRPLLVDCVHPSARTGNMQEATARARGRYPCRRLRYTLGDDMGAGICAEIGQGMLLFEWNC